MDKLQQYSNYILIDVRDDDEYRNGHIPGAINLPYAGLIQSVQSSIPNKDQLIMVYCNKGYRSSQSVDKLQHIGYKNVIWLGSIKKYIGELEKS